MPDRAYSTAASVQMVVTDVDGTLTDGGMYYSSSGDTFKRFHVRDGLGVRLLAKAGIEVVWISSDSSQVIAHRAERLDLAHCHTGVTDKVEVLRALCERLSTTLDRVAFLGDDLQDLSVLEMVGYPAAVGDAHELIKRAAVYQCSKNGGYGAFRELAEHLLSEKGEDLADVWKGVQG